MATSSLCFTQRLEQFIQSKIFSANKPAPLSFAIQCFLSKPDSELVFSFRMKQTGIENDFVCLLFLVYLFFSRTAENSFWPNYSDVIVSFRSLGCLYADLLVCSVLCHVLFSSHCHWPSNDCAACFQSNLLQDFSKLSPGRSRKSRSRQVLDALWLELAVGLSFSTDGQQMLLRIDGQCRDGQIRLWDESWNNEPCEDGCGVEWQALWGWLWCRVTSPVRMVVV